MFPQTQPLHVISSYMNGGEPAGVETENQAIFVFLFHYFFTKGSVGRFPVLFATERATLHKNESTPLAVHRRTELAAGKHNWFADFFFFSECQSLNFNEAPSRAQ